jgi:diguanylate cyclase (GGDEF)-like protein
MTTLKTFDSSMLSLMVLLIMYLDAHSRLERKFTLYNFFMKLVLFNMALIMIDLSTWSVDGLPGVFGNIAVHLTNFLLFAIEPLGLVLWILYANYLVHHDETRITNLKKYLVIPLILNLLLSILSLSTGWFFTVDQFNFYHRGDFYWIHLFLCIILLLLPFPFIFKNRKKIPEKHFFSLLFFIIPISVGTTLQVLSYGVTYVWSGMMVSLLIVYLTIQDRESSTDFLTEVNNRKQLDHFIRNKINSGRKPEPFSIILIDLDHFKEINDRYGHDVGDEALQDAVKVLRKCLRQQDFLARYGGDEFLIVMDVNTSPLLEATIQRIKDSFTDFNRQNRKPYTLSFSSGYYLYDYHAQMGADQLLKHLHKLMYQDKERFIE